MLNLALRYFGFEQIGGNSVVDSFGVKMDDEGKVVFDTRGAAQAFTENNLPPTIYDVEKDENGIVKKDEKWRSSIISSGYD